MADEAARCKGVLVGHGDDFIVDLGVQHIGDKACADALDLVCTGSALAQDRGGGGLHSHDLDIRVLALQVLANTGHSATGADACHKEIDLAVGVIPDLGAGGGNMSLGVGGVDELTGDECVGNLLCQLIGLGNGTFHALGTLAQDQLRAIGFHQLAALHAHSLGHDNDDAVALGSRHGSQADAGVAGGGLDDDGTRFELAGSLGVVDHGLGNAVLDGTGRVEILQLGQDLGRQVFLCFNVGQLQQRSVADQLIRGSINLAHNTLSSLCGRLALLFRGGPGCSHNSINQYGLWV